MSADKVIDLRSLQNAIAGKVELNDGVHDVRRFNAAQYQLAVKPILDPDESIERSVQLVRECVPTLPEAVVRTLPPPALIAIVTLASQGIEAVGKLFPNVESPEGSPSPG